MEKQFSLVVSCLCFLVMGANATVRYVKPTASGDGLGGSWLNASADIQAIINASASGDDIWVAAGTYKPNTLAGNGGAKQDKAFVLKKRCEIVRWLYQWRNCFCR